MKILKDIDYSALRRGAELVCDDFDNEFLWPRCEINNCSGLICIGMSKNLCYPHGIEFGAFTKEEFDRSRNDKQTRTYNRFN